MVFDAKKVAAGCIDWVGNFFEENGKGCNAVIGISGGKDSTVAADICVKALGKDHVIGILMPNGVQADIGDSYRVVKHLGIQYHVVDISDEVKGLERKVATALGGSVSIQTRENLPPRVRMSTLYAFSQSLNGRVVNTCNLSEDWVGYSTRYGDSVGDFSPLSYLTVTEVCQIGIALGLPRDLVYKVPSDGLCGRSDEEKLGFTYAVLDRYIRTGEISDMTVKERIDRLHHINAFKLKKMPCFEYKAA